jgi:hypothetical protein
LDTDTSPVDTDTSYVDTDTSRVDTDIRDTRGTDIEDTDAPTESEPRSDSEDTASPDTSIALDTDVPSVTCSKDMHSRMDASGEIIETCPPDQGCLNGECVPSCNAAAAAEGNVGCDFVIPRPSYLAEGDASPCFAVFVANTWNRSAALSLSRADTTYDVGSVARVPMTGLPETDWPALPTDGVPAEQVAVLFLEGGPTHDIGCPVTPAVDTNTRVVATGRGKAWHLTSDTPVAVYDILPYGGAKSYLPSAGMILPTTSWKTDYLAVLPPFFDKRRGSVLGGQWGQIAAAEDDTVVDIVSPVDLPAGTDVAAATAGAATRYILNRGEFIQWQEEEPIEMEMTGAVIVADRPVSFIGGNAYLCIASATSDEGGCDSAHQQIPPVNAWGRRYAVAPFATRRPNGEPESLPYRIVGAEDDTTLTFDPPNPAAPGVLQQGEWINFEISGSFEVWSEDSNHPFYLAQMMPGSEILDGDPGDMPGDEEYVNLVPEAQFMSLYVFFTDLTYTTTTLTVTQCDAGLQFADVYLKCLDSPLTGWQPVGTESNCRWASVDVVRDDIGNGDCRNGPQAAYSSRPFGLMVWGIDYCASYAFPAGALVTKINDVQIPVI